MVHRNVKPDVINISVIDVGVMFANGVGIQAMGRPIYIIFMYNDARTIQDSSTKFHDP